MKKPYGAIALLLIGVLVSSLGITALIGVQQPKEATDDFSVMTSFFPLYTAALQVVGDCEGVTVSCLTQPTAGCMHDYQLSPAEMARLSAADVLLLNGADAKGFLSQALAALPNLPCVDTTEGLSLQEAACDEHEHEHKHAVNEHAWLSPSLYAEQVRRLCEGLCRLQPANATAYQKNAQRYIESIKRIETRMKTMALPFTHAVLFHDSVAYPASELSLAVVGVVPLGEEQGASAAMLATLAEQVRGKAVLFLYDSQYPVAHESLLGYAETAAKILWNSATKPIAGVPDEEVWLTAMEKNLTQLQEVLS